IEGLRQTYCPNNARNLFLQGLAELNLTTKTFPSLTLHIIDVEVFIKTAHIIQQELAAKLGIRCQIEVVSYSELFQRYTSGQYQLGGVRWMSWINDPSYTLDLFQNKEAKMNFVNWEDEEYKGLISLAKFEVNLKNRKALYKEAEKRLIDSFSIIPLNYEDEMILKSQRLTITDRSFFGFVDFSQSCIREFS
ncbi:MAG: hypothetical protein KDK96_12275, partial [Chlamydiia bacterium]|nr:hypothetical protein [Chlamydiia bacterium]